jgi:hypothetical protein
MDNYEAAWKALKVVSYEIEFKHSEDNRTLSNIIDMIELQYRIGDVGVLFAQVDPDIKNKTTGVK